MITTGEFRADLYYRLNLAQISLPPLRERTEDIELLLDHFRRILNRKFRKQVDGLPKRRLLRSRVMTGPGMSGSLKTSLRLRLSTPIRRIRLKDFPPSFQKRLQRADSNPNDERNRLLTALSNTNWNKTKAAEQLRWSRMTLYRKMAKYQLNSVPDSDTLESYCATQVQGEYSPFLH